MRAPAKRVFKLLSALQWDIICTDSSLNRRRVSLHTPHVISLTASALIDQLNIEWQFALTCHAGPRMLHCWFPPVDMKNIFDSINVCCQSAWWRRPGQEALTTGAGRWQTAARVFGQATNAGQTRPKLIHASHCKTMQGKYQNAAPASISSPRGCSQTLLF